MCASANDGAVVTQLGRHVGDVLTLEGVPDVADVPGRGAVLVALCHIVHGELLVVGHGVHLRVVEEAGEVHGAVVEGLDDDLVLVRDAGVADVDEAVGGAGEQDVGGGGVEVQLVTGEDFGSVSQEGTW